MNLLLLILFTFLCNLGLGTIRKRYQKFTIRWWLLIHASIPFIIPLRIWLEISSSLSPIFIVVAIAGQYIGNMLRTSSRKE